MLKLKEERNKQKITLTQIAKQAGVDFRAVYRFDIGAFILMTDTEMEKIVKALSTLTNHPYTLSDFVPEPPHVLTPHLTEIREEGGQWKSEHGQQRVRICSMPKTRQNSPV